MINWKSCEMRKLFYVPLESYRERYTMQLSAPKTGWLERKWVQESIPYERIEGETLNKEITVGSVLDACGRGYWSNSQVMKLLQKVNSGEIKSGDCIFFDDFWHPGISALPYAFELLNIHPRMYAVLYAQSVDIYDFTYPMRNWMRHFEVGIGKVLRGIFVASTTLRDLCLYAGIGREESVHVTGLIYDSEEVKSRFPTYLPDRQKQVIYCSRWDREKDPLFFLEVVKRVHSIRPDIRFVITTSSRRLRSNDSSLLDALDKVPHIVVKEGLTKSEYYYSLLESKIQMNTADQDWVSFTLLESTTCGCRPLYPYFLSFPEALEYRNEFMYVKGDVESAVKMILSHIDDPDGGLDSFSWVYRKYDLTWKRMLNVMECIPYDFWSKELFLYEKNNRS